MKLSVAANWDPALLEGLAGIPEVASVYAKLPFDLVGGGRAGAVLPPVSWDEAESYIRAAHDRGIKFCYLINAPCLGNLEQTPEGKRRLLDFVGRLVELGVDSVSISNLALVALVRRNFPHLPIRGSVLSWPTSLARLREQAEMGVDPLILPYSEFTRDFEALSAIRRGLTCGLVLFANISCIHHCHYLAEHAASVGHASQDGGGGKGRHSMLDAYLWRCTRRRLAHPEQFLMSRWIRPEDISFYEAMGFDEFKIIDRSRSTDWLLRATRAYAGRRYDGNLLDIVSLELLGDPAGFHRAVEEQTRRSVERLGAEDRRRALGMLKLRKRLLALNVSIDNRALEGFLEGFRSRRCRIAFCDECAYCRQWAERTVRYDREEAAALVAEIDALLDDSLTGGW